MKSNQIMVHLIVALLALTTHVASALTEKNYQIEANSNNVLYFYTRTEIDNANIPQVIKDDIIEDLENTASNATFEHPIVIDLDAAKQNYGLDGYATPKGLCSGKWDSETKTFNIPLNKDKTFYSNKDIPGVIIDASLSMNLEGTMKIDVNYKRKRRCGIYYKWHYIDHLVDVDVQMSTPNRSFGINGTATVEYNNTISLMDNLTFYNQNIDFWVGPIWVTLDTHIYLKAFVDLMSKSEGQFETQTGVTGRIRYKRRCDKSDCRKLNDANGNPINDILEIDSQDGSQFHTDFGFAAKIIVRPTIELVTDIDLEFFRVINPVDLQMGVGLAVPITYDFYYGSTCDDANQDGHNELVSASLIDVSMNLYLYSTLKVHGERLVSSLSVNVAGFNVVSLEDDELNAEWRVDKLLYEKNLYFKDLEGSSSALTPIIDSPLILDDDGSAVILKARSCYPYDSDLTYEISWGDGTVERFVGSKSGLLVNHTWSDLGDFTISARIIEDTLGRNIASDWTDKTVNISHDGQSAYYPWLIPVITNIIL